MTTWCQSIRNRFGVILDYFGDPATGRLFLSPGPFRNHFDLSASRRNDPAMDHKHAQTTADPSGRSRSNRQPEKWDALVRKDLKTLALFVELYCHNHHPLDQRRELLLPNMDVPEIVGRPITLCRQCAKLLTHAWVKRAACPMDPKPMCKHCPNHCYAPEYRLKIQEVMRYSGRKMVLGGRLDYLYHLFF